MQTKEKVLIWHYPKCTTCQKAIKELKELNYFDLEFFHIKEETPSAEQLKKWLQLGTQDLSKFFNTSGLVYKNLNLKERRATLAEDEQLQLISSEGMLIKRPIFVFEDAVYFGYGKDVKTYLNKKVGNF